MRRLDPFLLENTPASHSLSHHLSLQPLSEADMEILRGEAAEAAAAAAAFVAEEEAAEAAAAAAGEEAPAADGHADGHADEQPAAADGEGGGKKKKKKDKTDKKRAEPEQPEQVEAAAAEEPAKKKKKKKGKGAAADPAPAVAEAPATPAPAPAPTPADEATATTTTTTTRPAGGTAARAFQRVKDEEWLGKKGAWDNSYEATFGGDGWGAKAQAVLGAVRGKDFRHEKTKKKRGSYKGGAIDPAARCSYKFDSD